MFKRKKKKKQATLELWRGKNEPSVLTTDVEDYHLNKAIKELEKKGEHHE